MIRRNFKEAIKLCYRIYRLVSASVSYFRSHILKIGDAVESVLTYEVIA